MEFVYWGAGRWQVKMLKLMPSAFKESLWLFLIVAGITAADLSAHYFFKHNTSAGAKMTNSTWIRSDVLCTTLKMSLIIDYSVHYFWINYAECRKRPIRSTKTLMWHVLLFSALSNRENLRSYNQFLEKYWFSIPSRYHRETFTWHWGCRILDFSLKASTWHTRFDFSWLRKH